MPTTLIPVYLNKTDYVYNSHFDWFIHKDYIGVNGYWFKDEDGNEKPIIFQKRWWDGEKGATDDYYGYANEDGNECIVKWEED